MKRLLLALFFLVLNYSLVRGSAVVAYLNEQGGLFGYPRPEITDPASALAALATTPSAAETGQPLTSGIPAGTRVLGLQVVGDTAVVEFSSEIIGAGLDEVRLESIFRQVKGTLEQFGLPGNIRLQCGGRLLSSYLPPVKSLPIQQQAKAADTPTANLMGLAGKKVSISPGHGLFWSGSGWANARPVYCAPLLQEDYNNTQIAAFLVTYLAQDGVTVKDYRCVNQNYGTYTPANHPWWHMAACYWTKQKGYPCSVYASYTGDCTLASGGTESNDAIRAGPVAADYDNTDAHIALHSNGSSGYCVGAGCPTGTETYYDSDPEHAAYTTVSKSFATFVHNSLISTIQSKFTDSTWTSRGVRDAAGAYAETRIPKRAAILIELAFHDTCDHDALDLRDNFFLSTSMWAVYKGVCDYFGTTPTWDYYSYEALSNSLPATMTVRSTTTATITLRNRGVLWNDTKQFRLGAVGDSDPFGTTTRYNVGAEISPSQIKTFTITLTAPATPGTYTTDWRMLREAVTWFGPTVSKSIAVIDNVAPSVPTNLTATPVAFSRINLSWAPSTDNVGVSNYLVYRDSVFLGASSTTSYADNSCTTATTYSYRVSAIDASRNESAKSSVAQATTLSRPSPVLYYKFESGVLTLTWTNAVLQEAGALTGASGDWADLDGTNSPYLPAMGAGMMFYRLRY